METQNYKKGFPKKLALAWFAILALVTGIAACGNKSSNNNTTTTTTVTPTCANCSGITPSTLVTATSSTPIQAAWVFNGDLNTMNSIHNSNPYANLYEVYNGSLTLTGTMTLSGQITTLGNCVLPAGTYTMTTVSMGTANYGVFNVPQVSATNGSTVINFSIANGVFYTYGSTNVLASGYMNLSTVNGAACYGQIYFN